MITPRILAHSTFRPEDIEVTMNKVSNRATTPEIEQQIDAHWEVFYAEAKAAGKNIWNGVTYRVNEFAVTEERKLKIEFAPNNFKTIQGLTGVDGYWSLPEEYWRKGGYVGSFVKTSDNYFVFVILSGRSLSRHKVNNVVGGVLDDEVPLGCGDDIYKTMYKELEEETAIPRSSVARCDLETIYYSPSTLVGFHFGISLLNTKEEVEARFKQHGGDDDIHDLLFVTEADMPAQLTKMGGSMELLREVYFS
jgi:8-oxo-dGTP pyrophosphatase MutT (NUDIX family)